MRRRFYHMNPPLWDFSNYMTIESLGVASVDFMMKVEYTKDGRVWKTLERGETLRMKGECVSFKSVLESGESVGYININGRCNLRGNCLSLIFGDEASGKNDIHLYPDCFMNTFSNNEIINIDKGFLPATILSSNCYYYMFNNCTSLVNAPMLPATTLAHSCYESMFSGCSKLNYIKMLATDISAKYCLVGWVYGVASTGIFVKNPAMTSLPVAKFYNNYEGYPSGWTVVNDGEESGGKIVNHGVLKLVSKNNYKIYWEYPVESQITTVVVGAAPIGTVRQNVITTIGNDVSGSNYSLGPGESISHIESVTPTEDDTYIYEVTIE